MHSTAPQFLIAARSFTAAEIAEMCSGRLADGVDPEIVIDALSSLKSARRGSLIFVQSDAKLEEPARLQGVGAILCTERDSSRLPAGPARILVDAPHRAFVAVATQMFPDGLGPARVSVTGGIDDEYPLARVSKLAKIEPGASIEPGAVIGDFAAVGRGSVIGANSVIANHCQIGRDCRIGSSVTIQHALIGNGVTVQPGAQIGSEGFGFIPGASGVEKVPQLGRVIVQDRAEIGAGTTIDRGALDDTVIGEGTKIDNLVQIAHNVVVGRNCLIAGHVGISGSVTLGDGCMLGGRVGIADHITIGSGVQIAASSGVMNDIPDGQRWAGVPAQPIKEFFREMATLRKLVRADKKPKTSS